MKILQDSQDKTRLLSTTFQLKITERKPPQPKSIILLLHGLDERGLRIYRKLIKYLPEDSYVLAPNAPFPLPRTKSDRIDYGYSWYFYDRFTKNYHIDQTLSLGLLKSLLATTNPEGLPVTIIGFSQGGYLAPLLGYQDPLVANVIGIGCEFRRHFFTASPHFNLSAIHGSEDKVILPELSQAEAIALQEMGIKMNWHLVANTKHEISKEVGLKVQELLEH